MQIELTSRISYIPGKREPLSSDIALIFGDKKTYIFDCGNGEEYINAIQSVPGDKEIIISHFHQDHTANLGALVDIPCYVGKFTYKYSKRGQVIESGININDGVKLHIFPLPNSHAKGSLGLEVDDTYVFIGDATAPAIKPGKLIYNTQLLIEEIRTLENLKAEFVIGSHHMGELMPKSEVLSKLKGILNKKTGNETFIEVDGI